MAESKPALRVSQVKVDSARFRVITVTITDCPVDPVDTLDLPEDAAQVLDTWLGGARGS